MILSFSVFREKIESGEKRQTIRKYSPGQYRQFLNCWKKRETTGRYNLFWHNPRNGGTRIRDAVPADKPFLIYFEKVNDHPLYWAELGEDNEKLGRPNELAHRDGFKDSEEMFAWFYQAYGEAMFSERFMVIRWLP